MIGKKSSSDHFYYDTDLVLWPRLSSLRGQGNFHFENGTSISKLLKGPKAKNQHGQQTRATATMASVFFP